MSELQPQIEGSVVCLTCGAGSHNKLSMDAEIAVGFGDAGFSKDGVRESTEPRDDCDDVVLASSVEALAVTDPDHDWRIYFEAPLYSAEYQRHGPGQWVLIRKGDGFA